MHWKTKKMLLHLHEDHLVIPWSDLQKVSPITLHSISRVLKEKRQNNASVLFAAIAVALEQHQERMADEEQDL